LDFISQCIFNVCQSFVKLCSCRPQKRIFLKIDDHVEKYNLYHSNFNYATSFDNSPKFMFTGCE